MDEFAMGSSNETSYFGNVLNPHNKECVPGGSSGGSAAAVAAGLCHASLGSDTGGSVRQPAAFCGTTGLKPTYGRISRYGLVAFASSLDQIGVFASTAYDTAAVLDIITGEDEFDATCSAKPSTETAKEIESEYKLEGFKVGTIKEEILKDCHPEIQKAYAEFNEKIKQYGGELVEIDFENPEAWVAIYQIVATAEASSNLARFDGVRYGFRAEVEGDEDFVVKTRSEGFGAEVKRRIMLGTYVLSSGYYDAYYNKALKARRMVLNNYNKIFEDVDFIAMPTTPTPPFKFGEKSDNPVEMYLSDYFTAAANLAGIPAISMPFGITADNIPVGMQLQAPPFEEARLMKLAAMFS
jgi:aspartyl-tRNA(Asn)/glutamyl-tRNA(Gln) amidotransferase subunit A